MERSPGWGTVTEPRGRAERSGPRSLLFPSPPRGHRPRSREQEGPSPTEVGEARASLSLLALSSRRSPTDGFPLPTSGVQSAVRRRTCLQVELEGSKGPPVGVRTDRKTSLAHPVKHQSGGSPCKGPEPQGGFPGASPASVRGDTQFSPPPFRDPRAFAGRLGAHVAPASGGPIPGAKDPGSDTPAPGSLCGDRHRRPAFLYSRCSLTIG